MKYALISLALVACSDAPSTQPDAAINAIDAAADAGFSSTCTGACQTTALTATFQATRTLDRAYFGVTASDGTLHVEAYRGGGTGCPEMNSPPPDYALILGKVTRPTSGEPSTSPGNILDYEGDMFPPKLGAKASTVTLTPVAAGSDFVAFDVSLTFTAPEPAGAGTVTGHFYATHCTSLDSP